jgi:hypothetical protein
MRKIFVARFDARILPLANSASVTPTTASVPMHGLRDDARPLGLEHEGDAAEEDALRCRVREDQRGRRLLLEDVDEREHEADERRDPEHHGIVRGERQPTAATTTSTAKAPAVLATVFSTVMTSRSGSVAGWLYISWSCCADMFCATARAPCWREGGIPRERGIVESHGFLCFRLSSVLGTGDRMRHPCRAPIYRSYQ